MSITRATQFRITVSALSWLSAPARAKAIVSNDLSPQLRVIERSDRGAVHTSREALTRRQLDIGRIGHQLCAEGGF